MLAIGVKLTAALYLPFALADARGQRADRRRRETVIGAGVAGGALAVLGFGLFGSGPLHLLSTVAGNQSRGDWHSIPGFISTYLGHTGGRVTGYALAAGFMLVTAWLLRRVWRGELDWIVAAGWATVAMLVTASSLLPWYVAWLMPFAALGGDRRLWRTAIILTGVMQGIQLLGYVPYGRIFG